MSNLELLKKLIEIESVSPNDNGCFEVIKKEFDGLNFSFKETKYKNISNLIITNGNSKNKTFCFLSHTARTTVNFCIKPSFECLKWMRNHKKL